MSVTLELPLALHILEAHLAENKYIASYVFYRPKRVFVIFLLLSVA
jgi:hypothetical protein